jgi:type I restriction enzyme S subunit
MKLNRLSESSAQPGLSVGKLLKISLTVPPEAEQTKIANFLSAVDNKISQLTKKHELLSSYKKGVLQKIFSQELRFKDDDGREFSEWEQKPFGDVYDFFQTNSFSRDLLSYEAGIIKNIHYGDIHTKFKSNFSVADELVPFIKPEIDISRIPKECYCIEGDLIIADASEDYADVGKAIEIIKLGHTKLVSGLHTYIARNLLNTMALGFGGYLMQAEKVRLQIKTLASGISVLGISKGNLAKVTIPVPSKDEQTKIANFLTAIDDKITNVKSQLESTKQYKQGLLQQMFV